MIHIEDGLYSEVAKPFLNSNPITSWVDDVIDYLTTDVSVDRSTNTLKIARRDYSSGLWNSSQDVTYFNLAGWSGRYGKPFELLLSLHLATMAPDFVYQIAYNSDLDTKVNIGLLETTFTGSIQVKTTDGLSYSIDQIKEDEIYSEDTIAELEALEEEAQSIKTQTPYIKTVKKHWFRNVYFDTEGKSVTYAVKKDDEEDEDESESDDDSDEDEEESEEYVYEDVNGVRTLKTTNGVVNVYSTSDTTESFTYSGTVTGLNNGETVVFTGSIASNITQVEDGVRGETNATTKELFNGEYYIYDGTTETAEAIRNGEVEKQQITFNDESLTAFSILEEETSIDSQLIYRDLKELLVELDYFDYSDFDEDAEEILEWPIPDYQDTAWPDRAIEKEALEYGTKIASKSEVDAYNEEQAELETDESTDEGDTDSEESNDDTTEASSSEVTSLDGFIMIGDSWTVGLEQSTTINSDGVTTYAKSGYGASNWLDEYSTISSNTSAKGVIVYLGLNYTSDSTSMKTLLGKLKESYSGVNIYVLKVPHVAQTADNADTWNAKIDTRNSAIESYCSSNGMYFIDANDELVGNDGYLSTTYASGGFHLTGEGYKKLYENIQEEIFNTSTGEDETVGFEPGLDVVAMANCTAIEKVNLLDYGEGIKFQINDTQLEGYYLIMAGFDVDVTIGNEYEAEDVIGQTTENSIILILIDLEDAYVENVEEWVKVPTSKGLGDIVLGDDYDVHDETYFVTDIEQFKTMFASYTNIVDNAQAFLDMQEKYQVNAVFAACVTIAESGGGTAWAAISSSTYNWFSIKGSYNGSSYNGWRNYPSFAAAVDDFGNLIANGSYYYRAGKYLVSEIGPTYCNAEWAVTVSNLMTTAYEKVI